MIKYKIEGLDELGKALREELPKTTERTVLRRSAINVMKPMAERMAQLAPRDKGHLAGSMKVQSAKRKLFRAMGMDPKHSVLVLAGPAPKTAEGRGVAGFNEFGTYKMLAHPYARPAADAMAASVIANLRKEIAANFEKAKTRIARKAARLAARTGG